MNIKVHEFIYNLRKKYKLTQQELASRLGVTFQAVSKWENGKSIPDILTLHLISKEFNVDITEILEGKTKKQLKKWPFLLVGIFLFVIMGCSFFLWSKKSPFEFKTLVADNTSFSIDGVVAYSKDKSSIYISSINMMEEDLQEYKVVKCTLFESHTNSDKEISSCENSSNETTTLSNLLQDISFYVNDDSIDCKNLSGHTLYLMINAMDENHKEVRYKIPLRFEDYCE
ncbi:MAG: helix-turn-helix domain-containing protein [Bacilli bacterium]|nr:helix-turn-helix domain-containing protein [Bacilli bacterium]